MEHNVDIEEVRRKANALLQNLLERNATRPTQEVAHNITNLAFEDGNPVRDLFLTAVPTAPPIPTSSTHSLKSRASSKFQKLTRREHKTPVAEGKASTPYQPAPGSSSSQAHGGERQNATLTSLPATQRTGNDASTGALLYNCILCGDDMSSKGVCKRHLEEQHVLPKTFKCERCGEDFTAKSDAKKHCNRCGLGVFTYSIVKPPSKKIYASEFTEEWFSSKNAYLEHLLKLSKKDATRLRPSPHCKLRALLGHPSLLPHVNSTSKRLFGSSQVWRSMRWSDEQLQAAIAELEDAAILQENGMVDFGNVLASTQEPFDIRLFLQNLLSSSTLSVSHTSQSMSIYAATAASNIPDRKSSIATTVSHRTTSPMTETVASPQSNMDPTPLEQLSMSPRFDSDGSVGESAAVPHDLKVKRHLSDDSRFYEPPREPPGPTTASVHFRHPFDASQQLTMPDMVHPNLPYQPNEDPANLTPTDEMSMRQMQFHPPLVLAEDLPSATASSTTLVSNYQEPKFLDATPITYQLWNPQPQMGYIANFEQPSTDSIPYMNYQHPDDVSIRTPSIASTQTGVSVGDDGPKLQNFLPLTAYPAATFESMLPNSDQQQQYHDMNQHPG